MGDDIDLLWALVSGVLIFVMAVGIGAVIEGFTRRRSVATGAGRHLAATAGAIGGSFGTATVRTGWFDERAFNDAAFWGLLCVSVLISMIVSGAIVERGTFFAHTMVGVLCGGFVAPAMDWAQDDQGVLSSIAVGAEVFTDAAAATIFGVSGWMALVGIMVIGPRRGRLGADGQVRVVSGKSMPTAALGALLVLATSIALVTQPDGGWDDSLAVVAPLIALSAVAGVAVAVGHSWVRLGASSTASMVHGLLAGVVAATGAPLELTALRAIVLGSIGSLLAMLAISFVERLKIDDPVGVVGSFGAAGTWGTLAAATSFNGVVAQLAGSLVIAAFGVVAAGVFFGLLRGIRLLRISPEVEVVGLEA